MCLKVDMFLIIAFDETNETDFVPVRWIADNTRMDEIANVIKNRSLMTFYWPPMKSPVMVSKVQSQSLPPEVTWPIYSGRILSTASKLKLI